MDDCRTFYYILFIPSSQKSDNEYFGIIYLFSIYLFMYVCSGYSECLFLPKGHMLQCWDTFLDNFLDNILTSKFFISFLGNSYDLDIGSP